MVSSLLGQAPGAVTGAAAEPPGDPSETALQGALLSASWRWVDKIGDLVVNDYIPMLRLDTSPGGAVVWPAWWRAIGDTGNLALRLDDVPVGVTVSAAGFPHFTPKGERAEVTGCRRTKPTRWECGVSRPAVSNGNPMLISPLLLSVGKGIGPGQYSMRASLLDAGRVVPSRENGQPTTERPTLIVRKAPSTDFLVGRVGSELVTAQTLALHRLSWYRLSGPSPKSRGVIVVRNMVEKRIRPGVQVKGRGWSCRAATCRIGGAFKVGQSSKDLGMLWQLDNDQVRSWPKIETAEAYQASWHARWSYRAEGKASQRSRGAAQDRASGSYEHRASLIVGPEDSAAQAKAASGSFAKSRRTQVTVVVQQLGAARAQGQGLYRVEVSNGSLREARDVTVTLDPPARTKVTRVYVPNSRWRCSGQRCSWIGPLRGKKVLPSLKVRLASKQRAGDAGTPQRMRAVARFRDPKRARIQTAIGVERTVWLKPLRVEAGVSNPVVHSGSGIQTVLTARVSNPAHEQTLFRWQQVCADTASTPGASRACPKVTWAGPRRGSAEGGDANARFTPPTVRKPTVLRFRVSASANGMTASDFVTVRVVPASTTPTRWQARLATTKPSTPEVVAQRLNNRRDRSSYEPLRTKPAMRARINSRGPTTAVPGERVNLRFRTRDVQDGAELRRVTWSVNGLPISEQSGARVTDEGAAVSFRLPKGKRHVLVTAVARLSGGRTVTAGEVVVPKPKAGRGEGQRVLRSGGSTFCDFYGDVTDNSTVTIGALSMLAVSVTTDGSSCTDTDASLSFDVSQLDIDGVTFNSLTVTMTPTQVTIDAATIDLPGAASGITVSSASISATFSSTGLGSLSGSVTLGGLTSIPYWPSLDNWSVSSASLSLSTTGNLSVSLTAQGPNDGQVVISGSMASGAFTLNATAQNVVQLTSSSGSTLSFGGTGTVSVSSADAVTFSVTASASTTTGFELIDDVYLQSASVTVSNTGLQISGAMQTTIGTESVTFSMTGSFTSSTDFSITISTTATPSISSLPLTSLTGSVSVSSGSVSFDITATVSVDDAEELLGLTLSTASASILNSCPSTDSGCTAGQLRLELDVSGSVEVLNTDVSFSSTVDIDITTGDFDFDVSVTGQNFGPSEAELNDVSFFVSDDGTANPNLANNPCYTAAGSPARTYGFTATATILGDVTLSVTGVYNGASESAPTGTGYCFYGQVATADIDQLSSIESNLDDSLNFLYASYSTTVQNQTIQAESPTLWAQMTLPQQVQTYMGVDGFDVLISISDSGGSWSLIFSGTVELSSYLAGGPSQLPSFEVTTVTLSAQVSTSGVELSLQGGAILTTPGSPDSTDPPMTSSIMNFTVTIGLDFGSGDDGGSLNLSANLESSQPVTNALGVSGLTLEELGVSLNVGFDALINSSLTVSSVDLVLPPAIENDIGLENDAPITFSVTLGIAAPCFDIAIGTPPNSSTSTTPEYAIQWGDVVDAYYFHLLLAPLGNCVMADGTPITGNFAVSFDGYILGVQTDIQGEVEIEPSFSADIEVNIAAFQIAGMNFNQTVIGLNFQPAQQTFDLSFSGGANLFSTVIVQVAGKIDVNLGATESSIDISFTGSLDTNLFGIFTEDISWDIGFDAQMSGGSWEVNSLTIQASAQAQILIFQGGLSLDFTWSNGEVTVFTGSLDVGLDLFILDFYVDLSFSFDPAVNGNNDLYITITGGVKVDLWLFTINVSVSVTFTIDGSFLDSNEYNPVPAQQISPLGALSGDNTNPDYWSYRLPMFAGNNFGALASGQDLSQAIAEAVGGSSTAGTSEALDELWMPGYFTENWTYLPSPGQVPWIMSNSLPGAYTDQLAGAGSFSVQPTGGSGKIGSTTDPSDTYYELEVTATLPQSSLNYSVESVYKQWLALADMGSFGTPSPAYLNGYAQPVAYDGGGVWVPNLGTCSSQSTTVTWTVQIPQVPNASPQNWAWVIMDTNWRLFGSSLRESSDMMLNVWDEMPTWSDWNTNNATAYSEIDVPLGSVPIPFFTDQLSDAYSGIPGQSGSPGEVTCGYEDFATQSSLYDFVTGAGIDWWQLPPPAILGGQNVTTSPYTSDPASPLQPGWGSGWQPYDLTGVTFGQDATSDQYAAFNVWVNPDQSSDVPCDTSQVTLAEIFDPDQLWGDPNDDWVDFDGSMYVQLEASTAGDTGNPWMLRLFESQGNELRWNGSSWITEPSGGWTSSDLPFSSAGQLFAASTDGVIYTSSEGHSTYLAFAGDNSIADQVGLGSSDLTLTYQPTPALNTCVNGQLTYANPNATQGVPPSSPPTQVID